MKHLDVIKMAFNLPWDPTELDEEEVLTKDTIVTAKANPTGTEVALEIWRRLDPTWDGNPLILSKIT